MFEPLIEIFFSHSFKPEDDKVVSLVRAVGRGLRMVFANVSTASTSGPPQEARDLIDHSLGLVGLVTKRDPETQHGFAMPSAVREEVAIAHGLKKPILLLIEQGVHVDGFMNNYATHLTFDRVGMHDASFIEKLVAALSAFRRETSKSMLERRYQFAPEYVAEFVKARWALAYAKGEFLSRSSITKRLIFELPLQREITHAVWPNPRWGRPGRSLTGRWGLEIEAASRAFTQHVTVPILTADHLELRVAFEPEPGPGDFIEYTRWFESPLLNPLFKDELTPGAPPGVVLGSVPFDVYDGVYVTERTKQLSYHASFAREYGLRRDMVKAFCAEKTLVIDGYATSEMPNVTARVSEFGRELITDLSVDNPQPPLFYGFAWRLPTRPANPTDTTKRPRDRRAK